MRIVPTLAHAVIDYIVGVLLLTLPWLLGLGPGAATWAPTAAGAVLMAASVCTKYELGVFRVLPMPAHLALDGLTGLVLVLAALPWTGMVRFTPGGWIFPCTVGVLEIVLALITRTDPAYAPRTEEKAPTR